jgi:iron complex outermembrane receptor protein
MSKGRRGERFSSKHKLEAVLGVLRGEDLDTGRRLLGQKSGTISHCAFKEKEHPMCSWNFLFSVRCHAVIPAMIGVLSILPLATPAVAAETGNLEGTVSDGETGDPLFAAHVLITSKQHPSTRYIRLTDEEGRFRIDDLAIGPYDVRTSFIGYETHVIESIEVHTDATARVMVTLSVEPIAMKTVVITASRRKEMILDAPAAVHVIRGGEIRTRQVLTPTDHLQGTPSVDVARSGLNQSSVVLRGFNNVFSDATLMLVDNRISRVPAIRANVWHVIPTINEDLERIEVVSGPGSALYGPNSANGVVHMITRSPFGSEGTTVALAGGDQDVVLATVRHAGSAQGRIGWKLSARWFQGTDFAYEDPVEVDSRAQAIAAGADAATLKIGVRDHDAEMLSMTGHLDAWIDGDAKVTINGGFNRVNGIQLTAIGAIQAVDWTGAHGQARLSWGDFFAQTYLNRTDAGETYNLRTGETFKDQSMLIVTQAQHQSQVTGNQTFTYGLDALLTRPDTEGTVHGRNEEDDAINEIGGYLQSNTRVSDRWSLVAAARIDSHNHIDGAMFSPRAALVFGPTADHKIRATYNRAHRTPHANSLFLDLVAGEDLGGFAEAAGSGEGSGFDLWAKGVPEGGFHFRRDDSGGIDGLYMQVPAALGGPGASLYAAENPAIVTGLDAHIPASARSMWPAAVMAVKAASGGLIDLEYTLPSGGSLAPMPGPEVGTTLRVLDTTTGSFEEIDPATVQDLGEIRPTVTNTLELGYKGTFGDRFSATIDVHHNRIKDFVRSPRVETPNVFFDPTDPDFAAYLMSVGIPAGQVPAVIEAFASVPLGTVTPEGNEDPADLILTYRNFGDIDLTGFDLGLEYRIDNHWRAGATYSFVSEDFFENVEGQLDVALNAPKHKAGGTVQFTDDRRGITAGSRVRYVDGFPVESGVYTGDVSAYTLLDLNASYRLPAVANTVLSIHVLNVLDDQHRELVGAPEIGRVGLLRLTHTF